MADPSLSDDSLEYSYDEVPYPGHSYHQSDPIRLYTLATLFGLKPTRIESASVLELGCGDGANLIPMAFHFPSAQFIGIDISGKEIEDGNKNIDKLQLANIKLKHQSMLDFNNNDKFDYIICHGVYSWVEDKVKDKILQICDDNLKENGIAYICYNTYPGWHMVNSIRDLMLWYTKDTKNPLLKVKRGRHILNYFSEGLKDSKSRYAEQLRIENTSAENHSDGYLYHEHLSKYNEPVYFYQFMEQVTKYNLTYLCDATLANEYIGILDDYFVEDLKLIDDIVELGQKMDFIRNQRFRWSLLCHKEQKINRTISINDIEQYDIQFKGELLKTDLTEKDIGQLPFITISTAFSHMKITNPLAQMATLILYNNKNKPIAYHDLCKMISEKIPHSSPEEIRISLRSKLDLISGIFAGLFEISSYSRDYIIEVTEMPIACPLVRYLAIEGNRVTNRRHENIYLEVVSKCLLPFLDGSNDIPSLKKIAHNRLSLEYLNLLDEKGHAIEDKAEIDKRLTQLCTQTLEKLATQAILIG